MNWINNLPSTRHIAGNTLIMPVTGFWMENGYYWSVEARYDRSYFYDNNTNKSWHSWKIPPTYKLIKLGIKILGQEKPCKCKDCLAGRKKVREGWKPKIDSLVKEYEIRMGGEK